MTEIQYMDIGDDTDAYCVIEFRQGNSSNILKCFTDESEANEALKVLRAEHPRARVWHTAPNEF